MPRGTVIGRATAAFAAMVVVLSGLLGSSTLAADPSPHPSGSPQSQGRPFLDHKTQKPNGAASLPVAGFSDTVAITGPYLPTVVRFASDGRVVVAQKFGQVLVYPTLGSTSPVVAADFRDEVDDYWDRGLLGLALDPNFTTNGYIYVLYAYDHILGDNAAPPRWGDACPSPPGPTTDGCVVSGRLSRFQLVNNVAGPEQVLVEDWCQQFPSHSIGNLAFGPDGYLYASGGEGASFTTADWGQFGGSQVGTPTLANPCGDPPNPSGTANTLPDGRGGALRSQSVRRPSGEPVLLNGTLIRIDPATGAAAAGNPLIGNADQNARRIVAAGLRNPFRFTFRPGTGEVWIGDVGWNTWEEINRVTTPTAKVWNWGWPCYEGTPQQSGYSGLKLCQDLYADAQNPALAPYYSYNHTDSVVTGDGCPTTTGSAITGIAFQSTNAFGSKYRGALFFADKSRNCIWAMLPGSNGLPDSTKIELVESAAVNPVDIEPGPGGDLFYVDFDGGTIHRLSFNSSNTPPVVSLTANPTNGVAPLAVSFSAAGSSDPDGDALSYAWDFMNDGTTDATGLTSNFTYQTPAVYTAKLTVTDARGASSSSTVTITANNSAPTMTITQPSSSLTFAVGDPIAFSGSATDLQDGTLPASSISWTLIQHHCTTPTTCHTHLVQTWTGVRSGSFSAPDHDYPSYIELIATATDSGGLQGSANVQLNPKTVTLPFATSPGGLTININGANYTGTISKTAIVNSQNSVIASSPQVVNGIEYGFTSWSDGSTSASRTIVAPATAWATPLTANFVPTSADVSIVKTGVLSPDRKTITWTLVVSNPTGGSAASSLRVTDTLSTNLGTPAFSGPWACGYASSTRLVTCTLATLASGGSSTITITTPVVARKANRVDNTAAVTSTTRDVNSSNNSSSVSVKLN